MKKITCLFLCLLMACLFITSCSEDSLDKFKDDIHEYDDLELPEDKEAMEFDFYIICGEESTENSKTTVERMINSHLSDVYKTTLDIHYLSASEYEEKMLADAAKTDDDRADIVLIADKGMFDSLYNDFLVAELSSFYSGNTYGKLNTQIATSLLHASLIYENNTDSFGTNYIGEHYYTVPNNHVVGEYDYILINKEIARKYNYSNAKLALMNTYEKTAELRAVIGENADEYVKQVSGIYTDKAKYEAEGYFCNIASYPTATTEEAFKSAFAIIRHPLDVRHKVELEKIPLKDQKIYTNHYDRCMEIIYALNNDVEFRNLLQYGVKGTNYTVDDDGIIHPNTEGNGVYKMNILYTGNVFNAYYCDTEGYSKWTEADAVNGFSQNIESVIPTITVNVVDENGEVIKSYDKDGNETGYAPITVVIAHNVVFAAQSTNADGTVTKSFAPKGDVKVSLKNIPEGYAMPESVLTEGGIEYHAVLSDGVYSVTIELSKLPEEPEQAEPSPEA